MSDKKELSYSRISTWKRCFKRYYYKYIHGLKPKERPSAPRMGNMGHKGLQAKYAGNNWKEVVENYWKKEMNYMPEQFIDEEVKEEKELVIKVLERYFNHHDYFRHPDEKNIIKPETRFSVKIPNTNYHLIGYMDKVIDVPNEGIWLIDHKFTTQGLNRKLENLELLEQIDYYTWALTQMFPNKVIMGTIWNGIRLDLPSVPQPIKSGKRLSKAKIRTDYQTYYDAIIDNGFDPDDYTKMLTKLKNQDNPFFRTEWCDRDKIELKNIEKELIQTANEIDRDFPDIRNRAMDRCSWDCEFEDLCLIEKKGGDVQSIIEENFEYYQDDKKKKKEKSKKKPF